MKTYEIYIDTTTRYEKKVTLKKGNDVIDEIIGDIDITSSIQTILEKNNIGLNNVSKVIPSKGPGSFTGLKIGVTVANIINWVKGTKTEKDFDLPNYGSEPNIS